jgi:type IV secretory pathway ATPase VirB11/archaellum biosynthesis ATPase
MECENRVFSEGDDYILRINCNECPLSPSLEDNDMCMRNIVELLLQNENVTKIVLTQRRDYEYDEKQVNLLKEIALIYRKIARDKGHYGLGSVAESMSRRVNAYYVRFKELVTNRLKSDPVGTYVELVRLRREIKITLTEEEKKGAESIIQPIEKIIGMLEESRLITVIKPHLPGYAVGDRSVYSMVFSPVIKPDFMFTKLMASYPHAGEVIGSYFLEDSTEVTIFSVPDSLLRLYHVVPPELKLSEEKYTILDKARIILSEHTPSRSDFTDPRRIRDVFFHVGKDLIEEISSQEQIKLKEQEVDQLASILVRFTVGFGLIEILLGDENIQDITINSPQGKTKVFLSHSEFEDCFTNIVPSTADAESWSSKLRMISGRPLDEANPILDTEIELPNARARAAAISPPINPSGLAFAFRRHRNKPWTLPLFMDSKMLNATAAGLLSFLIDGSRTFLVAGTRSAGKTSLLGSFMVEVMRKHRIISIEDTLELPTSFLMDLGYNIQPMKVASALTKSTNELGAEEGIRTTLRMGDSCLFVGEVRSIEAQSLYEAMRIGALANVVAGTIHGDSPYGVYDRVVNDLKVPKTSFKATDIIVVANPIRSPEGLKRERRITRITEVRKNWEDDPLAEKGFVDLMRYDSAKDELVLTDELMNGESDVLKSIGSTVREWAGNWDAIWDNIMLRAKMKEEQVKLFKSIKHNDILEAEFSIECNDAFHKISADVKKEKRFLDSSEIFSRWRAWLIREARKFKK